MKAFLPEADLKQLLSQIDFAKVAPNTITTRSALLRELEVVRNEGIPVSDQELVSGLRSIAVPIRSRSGDVVAAISLAVHRLVVSMEQLRADFGARRR